MISGTNKLRAVQALAMRRNGMKLDRIAERFGITRERARQLSLQGSQLEQQIGDPWYELSPRVRNALITNGCEPTPAGVLRFQAESPLPLDRIPNIGKKCIAEIKAWLQQHHED